MIKNNVAEICGALIGDGWIQSNQKNLFISGHPTEDKKYYDKRLSKLLEETLGRKIKPTEFGYWGTYGIGIYRKEEIKKFMKIGIPTGKKGTVLRIPKIIRDSDIEVKKSFLRGLFDTDGSIYGMKQNEKYTRARLRITSISEELIDSVKNISQELGIEYSNPSPSKRGKNKPNRSYIFEINKKESIKKWFSIIKPQNPKHVTKFNLWQTHGYFLPRTTLEQREKKLSHLAKLKTRAQGN